MTETIIFEEIQQIMFKIFNFQFVYTHTQVYLFALTLEILKVFFSLTLTDEDDSSVSNST